MDSTATHPGARPRRRAGVRTACNLAKLGALAVLAACSESVAPDPIVEWADDPVQPAALRVVQLVSAHRTLCSRTSLSYVYCLGENQSGEFGNGSLVASATPVPGAGGTRWSRLFGSAVAARLCGIDLAGAAWCWGFNENGAVGDGSLATRTLPARVAGNHAFVAFASGSRTCALTVHGVPYCWGFATPTTDDGTEVQWYATPQLLHHAQQYHRITAGAQFTCALRAGDTADCWGWGGASGTGDIESYRYAPAQVLYGRTFREISAGPEHICGAGIAGTVYCWGRHDNTVDAIRSAPVPVNSAQTFVDVAAGPRFGACAIDQTGAAWCWAGLRTPVKVSGNRRWAGITPWGDDGYCGFTPGGSVFCWNWAADRDHELTTPARLTAVPAGA